ncbi:hypothetical protein GUITHDRAFT_113604 [Guillardia theta CCMP2712]|uniref:PDZ domain-containing protein n=1 Tax=Guillardia theta (strain CCMP2712) TaxID=905079 RepID=L1IWZ2_GUITC|nr:hypothetical protein GUITHDRAFT_113604 [Guillardia theta CCMP2712]EKX40365.1 hypothetical protein GUITHDRAFT_113604 [Guillardia theta CCMP2712]|eukprot:XP_005827345.1 hypothetical protein GUITHDRAFT_113604 [Guillardia theta CCMP2712]
MLSSPDDLAEGEKFPPRDPERQGIQRLEKPQLGGVGIVFQGTDDGGLRVSSVSFGGPAENKVMIGDILITVNSIPIDGMTDQELAKNLLGPVGSPVQLGVLRPGVGLLQLSLIRSVTNNQRNAYNASSLTP